MRLSLDALLVLDAIDRKGSFAAAADELHRVPSAITYTVQKLEQDLDVLLFDRRGHRAKLTAAGRELLDEGRHLLRAAGNLESRVKRVATGWEAELRIACDDVIPVEGMLRVVGEFHREPCPTRVRLAMEVLGGCWDALAAVAEPLKTGDILAHRAVAVADSARNLPPRTLGLIGGQETLTVPTVRAKLQAQVMGLGVGNLPRYLVEPEVKAGRLAIKRAEEARQEAPLYLAWRTAHRGKALAWFVKRLQRPGALQELLGT